eukprot:scaffold12653_cov31-Tisochrysis_lutea.AAC.3
MTRWRVREELPQNATEIELLLLTEVPPPAFRDVGDAVWFIIVTFTTVGFGDLTPNGHVRPPARKCALIAAYGAFKAAWRSWRCLCAMCSRARR